MSTSLLYHAFKVKHYKYLKTEYVSGQIIFHIEKKEKYRVCPVCGSREVGKKSEKIRMIKTFPIGKKQVWFAVHVWRIKCKTCKRVRQESMDEICYPKKHWAKSLERYILELLNHMTVQDVAEHLGLHWNTVKNIHKENLKKLHKRIKYNKLHYIGVDEVAIKKGHKYLSVVVDLETGAVVWVWEGRKADGLEKFLLKLKKAHAPIKAIAMDMWKPYIKAVEKYYGKEKIVFDRYHVLADYNRMLDELRRQQEREAPDEFKGIFKGTKYLLLKSKEKIEHSTEALKKLKELLSVNHALNVAYVMKEQLSLLWECEDRVSAETHIHNWLCEARASKIAELQKFANRLERHLYGILNYFEHRITTARVEGLNNKIKLLKRQAYGFRDTEYFKLRIYFLHKSRYALV